MEYAIIVWSIFVLGLTVIDLVVNPKEVKEEEVYSLIRMHDIKK